MKDRSITTGTDSHQAPEIQVPFASHEIRLSGSQCLIALLLVMLMAWALPRVWTRVERFAPDADYRLPYQLSHDYWLFARYSQRAAQQHEVLILGDSVVWGHYVSPAGSLSHHLNLLTGTQRFANMGIDGIHPVALAGLVKYYGRAISNKKVILCFNPLWMTSKKHDLQTEKEFSFNHPHLVPQFAPKIACYANSFSNRVGIALERESQFLSWVTHLKTAYFENSDLLSWTLEHPYTSPVCVLKQDLARPQTQDQSVPPWSSRGVRKQAFPWVDIESSLQWRFFRQTVEILQERGNQVFVLFGPFNEHMMQDQSLATYQKLQEAAKTWLRSNDVAYYVPAALPSEYYADASHPLSAGYRLLASDLLENESFEAIILNDAVETK
jgi:hypothetical protein